jgi:hypothetical protein
LHIGGFVIAQFGFARRQQHKAFAIGAMNLDFAAISRKSCILGVFDPK